MTLAPPPVAIGAQDSFHTAWLLPPLVEAQYAGLNAPLEVKASLLDGFQVQPYCSWVPPTDTTYGELAGHQAVGVEYVPLSLCCLLIPKEPKSPEAAKKLSCLASPARKTRSKRAVWVAAAPPKAC